jgi:mannan endo-1,4-beta-mannosidase
VQHRRQALSSRIARRGFLIGGAAATAGAVTGFGGGYLWFGDRPSEPRLFGISMTGSGPSSVDIAETVGTSLNRQPQVLNFFMAWQWFAPFPTTTVAAIRNANAVPEITWEPWDPRNGAIQAAYRLDNLASYDEYVDTFARGCAEYGDEICLRFGHEMNSDWYPWSVSVNGGTPAAYVATYRRLRQRFFDAGATNVRWVWCPNIVYQDRTDLIADSYPGDDVVDIVAVDGYNRGGKTPSQVFSETLRLLDPIGPAKPLWINEVGCTDTPAKAGWITDLFTMLQDTRVSCVVWFELDQPNTPDWRLLSTPESATAARDSLAQW